MLLVELKDGSFLNLEGPFRISSPNQTDIRVFIHETKSEYELCTNSDFSEFPGRPKETSPAMSDERVTYWNNYQQKAIEITKQRLQALLNRLSLIQSVKALTVSHGVEDMAKYLESATERYIIERKSWMSIEENK